VTPPEVGDAVLVQPRARGTINLSVKPTAGGTGIRNLRQAGSSKAVFPRCHSTGLEAVLVNTAGGVTGGDSFANDLCAESGTTLTLTTQAAERAYRAQPGEIGRVTTQLRLLGNARLNWLPQETILFDSSALHRSLSVEMDADATLLMVEPLVFGRAAMNETLSDCTFNDRISIMQNGAPLFLDQMSLRGNAAAFLARTGVANGAGAMASVVFAAPNADSYLKQVRALLSGTSGASLIRDNLLYIRVLAADSFLLRKTLIPILKCLNETSLPRSWML
jgi:urease accessory protein